MGINGVAISVDIMLVVGITFFFYRAKQYVDFSLVTLFLVPIIDLLSGMLISNGLISLVDPTAHWQAAAIKICAFGVAYSVVLFIFERRKIWEMFTSLRKLW